MGEYAYLVMMDISAELEDEFNRVYDTQHVPNIVKAPGVNGCVRYKLVSTNKEGVLRSLIKRFHKCLLGLKYRWTQK